MLTSGAQLPRNEEFLAYVTLGLYWHGKFCLLNVFITLLIHLSYLVYRPYIVSLNAAYTFCVLPTLSSRCTSELAFQRLACKLAHNCNY